MDTKARRQVTFTKGKQGKYGKKAHSLTSTELDGVILSDDDAFLCQFYNTPGMETLTECEACEKWSCLQCHDISVGLYKIFTNERNGAHWLCRNCVKPALEATKTAVQGKAGKD